MLAVIIEEKVDAISEYLGVDFCSDLPLITENLLSYQLSELKNIGVTDFVLLGSKSKDNSDRISHIENIQDLKNILIENEDNNIIITASNIFFQFKRKKIDLSILESTAVSFTGDSGEVCAVHLNKDKFFELLCLKNDINGLWKNILLNQGTGLKCADYSFVVENPVDYKNLLNMILQGKVDLRLPRVAMGVFAVSEIPKGDFVIVPPVFFGENVQIESNCVIGPYTVVSDNCLVSKNSYVKSSVLFPETFISSGCFIDNTICGENVSVRRDSAVFDGSVLGKGVTIEESTFVENNSYIRPFTNVSEYKNKTVNYKLNESCAGFCGYSPEKAALLGGAIGSVYKDAKIGILINNEFNANVLKYAVVSGLLSTGASCFDFGYGFVSSLPFYLSYCELDYGIFIKGEDDGTMISVVNKHSAFMPKDDFYSVKEKMLKGNIARCSRDNAKSIRQIKGMKNIYVHNLIKNFNSCLNVIPVFNSQDKYIENVCKIALSKLDCTRVKDKIFFNINESGTLCECEMNNNKYTHARLCDFVSYYHNSTGHYNSDYWRNDAVFLAFSVLGIIAEYGLDFCSEMENIPSFYVAEKVIETKRNLSYVASRLSENKKVSFCKNELLVNDNGLRFKIMENGRHNKIKVLARSYKAELAEELVANGEKFLLDIDV